jgi:hypothetical protein
MLRALTLFIAAVAILAAQDHTLGYDDTPSYPGSKWRVHDINRPQPEAITPGSCNAAPSKPPSDAEVLFDGSSLDKWTTKGGAPTWKVENGYVEIAPGKGDLVTKEKFGDIQLHLQWATPAEVSGKSQGRGNSGIKLMTLYEVQVLDSWNNPTYADGQAAAVYGQYPPLVNASCKPGEWQTYDIAFSAPKFADNAGLRDGVSKWRAGAGPCRNQGGDIAPAGRQIFAARGHAAAAAESRQSRPLP